MSTRTGKRINKPISENVQSVSEKQIERNTRSKRVKENSSEEVTGKKKNFVRRPSIDEVERSSDTTENTSKSVRKSKRYTLKELNVPADDYEALNVRKSMRQSRRIRKEDTLDPRNVFILETNEIETKEKRKNKKKRAIIENLDNGPVKANTITKKKTAKKKKKSNSFTVEEFVTGVQNKSFNKSNVSIDSFHSAAGSPDNYKIDDEVVKHGHQKEGNSPTLHYSVVNLKDTNNQNISTETDNQFESARDKSVKLCELNEFFESSVNKKEEIRGENVNRFDKEISGTLKTKSKRKRFKKRNSLSNSGNTHEKANIIHNLEFHNSAKDNSHCKDLKKKTVDKMNSPTSNVDLINISHVKGTVNDIQSLSHLNMSSMNTRSSTSINSSFDKIDVSMTLFNKCNQDMSDNIIDKTKIQLDQITINNTTERENPIRSKSKDATYEKINLSDTNTDQTFDKTNNSFDNNSNADIELFHTSKRSSRSQTSIKNTTYDKVDDSFVDTNTTINKQHSKNVNAEANYTAKFRRSSRNSLSQSQITVGSTNLNGTYDKVIKEDSSSFCNNTYDKLKLDTTFEKTKCNIDGDITINLNPTSSIISSDNTDNITSDMSQDCSRISIASGDSKTENIINTTPLLIESSMEEPQMNSASIDKTDSPQKKRALAKIVTPDTQGNSPDNNKKPLKPGTCTEAKPTPLKRDGTYTELRKTHSKHRSPRIKEHDLQVRENPPTPLQREGTFTKDSPDVLSPIARSVDKTPTRRKSMPSPGRTPFPSSGSGSRTRIALNVTHSIEKPQRRSSAAAAPPRPTRVMFRSPVDDSVAIAEMKGKIIKSNLKGSSKSFIFGESASEQCGSRKRSRTQGAAGGGAPGGAAKRARTASAAARLQAPVEATMTSAAAKSDAKPRTKLPDFAALHRRQFSKMESLDECQRRHARRARALLTPTALLTPSAPLTSTSLLTPTASLTPIAPRGTLHRMNSKETSDTAQIQAAKKPVTQKSKELDKKNQSYTRFGFKLNLDVNPFSVPAKPAEYQPKDINKPKATLPSLAGSTLRKEAAKQAVMREKSFTDRRDVNRRQNRTVIRGVRTNRRFELQMQMRNID